MNEEDKKIEKTLKKLIERIKLLQALQRKRNVLELAKIGTKGLGITGDEWDRAPMLLGCKNGVLELKTGTIRPGRPEDFIKTVSPVQWQGINEPASIWEKTILEIFDGNHAVILFVQRLLGYALTGLTTEHIFIIFWGIGRNGKGTLLEVLAYVLGELAGPVEAELLLKQKMARHSGSPTPDLMALRGKRLVWSSETNDGRSFNIGKIKWLTGGDTIVGRSMFGKHQTSFQPTHTFFLLTNHKPHANASEYAFWQRTYLIPFLLSFIDNPQKPNERKKDGSLKDKLKAEASGILAWLVRGCLAWQKVGLDPPLEVKTATGAYKQEEDLIGQFIESECVLGPDEKITAGTLYGAYRGWTESMGLTPISGVRFGKEMQDRFESKPGRHRVYLGIRLLHRNKYEH